MTGQTFRIYHHPQLSFAATEHVNPSYTGYPFQPFLDHVLDEISIAMYRAIVAFQPLQNEPGDGVVLGTGTFQCRFICLVRVTADAIESVGDQQQGAVHILPDPELQGDLATAATGTADHALQSLDTFERIFLGIDNFALDFGRCRTEPLGSDGDDRGAHVRSQLYRNFF